MGIIPVWQRVVGGVSETNIGQGVYTADFWESQGIYSTTSRPCIVDFRGDYYIVGAYTRPVYRSLVTKLFYPAGIVPPFFEVAGTLTGTGTGVSGAALGFITFLQKLGDRVLQESNPSNVVDFGTMAGEFRSWSNIQNTGQESHVTHVRGYVSMDGADYRMAWEAPFGLTTMVEAVATTRLSHNGPDFDHNIPPSGLQFAHPFAGRMFYANNSKHPYRVWRSKPGNPQYVPTDAFLDTYAREPVTGIWQGRNELVVFCQRNSYLIRQFGTGENDFVLERLDSNVGAITHFGIREIHNRLWFPAEDGIWIYDGAFHYLMPDLRKLWQDDYAANREQFRLGFGAEDRINKVYVFFTTRPDRLEWENTLLYPGTIRYVAYYANFEPSMLGEQRYPDWSLDFLDRFDSAALYTIGGEMLIASCDGIVRKQDETDGDDDGDVIGKELIIRTGHRLMYDPGGDIQSAKTLKQLWCHLESEQTAWTVRCLGGDADAWRQIFPDNVNQFWKNDVAASGLTQALTISGSTYLYSYCAKSVHYMEPEKVSGRGFTFEIRGTTPINLKHRGFGGFWAPGPAARPPMSREACTYGVLSVEDQYIVSVGPPLLAENQIVDAPIDVGVGGVTQLGQSFNVQTAASIGVIAGSMWNLSNPPGAVRCHIYAHAGAFGVTSQPTGPALATSEDVPTSAIPNFGPQPVAQWTRFVFASPPALAPGNYCFAFEYLDATPGNNVRLSREVAGTGAGNNSSYNGIWTSLTSDLNFQVFGDGVIGTVSVADLDDGSSGITYWRLELINEFGTVVQTAEGTNPASVLLTLGISDVGVPYTVRTTGWNISIIINPEWEPCAISQDTDLTVVSE